MIYLHSGVNSSVAKSLSEGTVEKKYATIIRCDTMQSGEKEVIKNNFTYYWNNSDQDGNYVKDNVYFISKTNDTAGVGIFDKDFYTSIVDVNDKTALKNSGFEEIASYIQEENIYRDI